MLPQAHSLPVISTIILLTTFFAIAFGFVFKDMLEYQVDFWAKNRQTQAKIDYKKPQMLVAYLGLTFFLTFFLGECLSVFKIGYLFAGGIALFVVLPTALLMWLQLGSMLELLSRGGSEAISIDTYLEEKAMKIAAKK
jgi:hypothetical protein